MFHVMEDVMDKFYLQLLAVQPLMPTLLRLPIIHHVEMQYYLELAIIKTYQQVHIK